MTATRRYLAAALLLCAVASAAAGSVFAGEDASTDRTLLRMGDGARRLTDRIVERPIPLEGLLADVDGTPPTPFEHSSGYFKLNRTKAAEMFYFYFKSRSATPSKDPVVLWMTGGPGCSSDVASSCWSSAPWNSQAERFVSTFGTSSVSKNRRVRYSPNAFNSFYLEGPS